MRIEQLICQKDGTWKTLREAPFIAPQLVLAFGSYKKLKDPSSFAVLRDRYPAAHIVMASTSGEINQLEVDDDTIAVTAISFQRSRVDLARVNISDYASATIAGRELSARMLKSGLRHLMIISDGQLVNGTYLLQGIQDTLAPNVTLSGGLAGDGAAFVQTLVGVDELPKPGEIIGIGFYGEHLHIGVGSQGGWDTFGADRIVTKSSDNVLYELDGENALALYKRYLGEKAEGLPGTALLFPLAIQQPDTDQSLVRTILSIDETSQSMTFAGNVPEGARVRLMRANFDRIIDGAAGAASQTTLQNSAPELAILISCVGRKGILGPRIDEEVESVADMLGGHPVITGFYSNGEISRNAKEVRCELHNQTMTIMTLHEEME